MSEEAARLVASALVGLPVRTVRGLDEASVETGLDRPVPNNKELALLLNVT